MMLKRTSWIVLAALSGSLAMGCSKLTYENWKTLTLQSPKAEVEAVLGEPNQYRMEDRWMYHDPDRQVTVNFEFREGDKVTYSRWVDPDHGVHEIGTAEIVDSNLIERETGKTDFDRSR